MVYQNREVNQRGFSHGGVAIVFRESVVKLRKVQIHNSKRFEVLVAEGNLKGCGKKIVIIACYLPPNYTVPRGREAMDYVAGMVSEAKRRHDDPYVLVAGDLNQ